MFPQLSFMKFFPTTAQKYKITATDARWNLQSFRYSCSNTTSKYFYFALLQSQLWLSMLKRGSTKNCFFWGGGTPHYF